MIKINFPFEIRNFGEFLMLRGAGVAKRPNEKCIFKKYI